MYKFFSPQPHMVLRPDITMPIACIAATKMKNRPCPYVCPTSEMFIDMRGRGRTDRESLHRRH